MKKLLLSCISLVSFWDVQAAHTQGNFKSIAHNSPHDFEMNEEDSENEIIPLPSHPPLQSYPEHTVSSNLLGLDDEEMSESTAEDKLKAEQNLSQFHENTPSHISPLTSPIKRDLFSPGALSPEPTMEEAAEQSCSMDIDHQDEEGRTFLMRAIRQWGYWDSEAIAGIIKMLVNSGADLTLVDNYGKGAANYILEHPLISQQVKDEFIKLSHSPESSAAEIILFPFTGTNVA